MTTIVAGQAATFTVQVQLDGAPVPLSGSVSAAVYSMDGRTELAPSRALAADAPGAAWPSGVAAVALTGAETGAIPVGDAMLVLSGAFGLRRYRLIVETLALGTRSSLFVRDIVVDEIRRDQLMIAAAGVLPGIELDDEYIWDKLRAAEAELAHELRVPLVPTRFFPIQPTDQEMEALDGAAWAIDPGYDYDPDMFRGDKWGYVVTRHRPIISVQYMRFCYPTQDQGFFDVPREWLRIDARVGHIRIIPASAGILVGSAGFALSTLIHRRSVPDMVQISYTAGLKDATLNFPELIDVVKKKAVLKVMMDVYLPQSGSISADGLSQSMSVDVGRYADNIDSIINGGKGSNGGLMAAIHGVRAMVF